MIKHIDRNGQQVYEDTDLDDEILPESQWRTWKRNLITIRLVLVLIIAFLSVFGLFYGLASLF